jgi:hypothetical protein
MQKKDPGMQREGGYDPALRAGRTGAAVARMASGAAHQRAYWDILRI